MNRFVQECRREWKRLRVPDAIANEMAADLSADLAEAEAEGASPEDVLGDAVFDAQSFAASWAAERGVVAPPQADAGRGRPATPLLLAGAVMLVTVLVGAVLVVSELRLDRGTTRHRSVGRALQRIQTAGLGPIHIFGPARPSSSFPRSSRLPVPPGPFFVGGHVDDVEHAGWILLLVGLVGSAIVGAFALLARRPRTWSSFTRLTSPARAARRRLDLWPPYKSQCACANRVAAATLAYVAMIGAPALYARRAAGVCRRASSGCRRTTASTSSETLKRSPVYNSRTE